MVHAATFEGLVKIDPRLNAAEQRFLHLFAAAEHDDGPSPHCHWIPDGSALVWDGDPQFEEPEAWLRYLINHFLKPNAHRSRLLGYEGLSFDHTVNGVIVVREGDTRWLLVVTDNEVFSLASS